MTPDTFVFSFVLAVASLLSGGVAAAQGPGQPPAGWSFGWDLFQLLLEEQGLRALPDLDKALTQPKDSVVVMLGAPPANFAAADWNNLIRFVTEGGSLLVASESSTRVSGFGEFVAGPVTTRAPKNQYEGFDDCLQLSPAPASATWLGDVGPIVTNRSGWFVPDPVGWLNWEVAIGFPVDSLPAASRRQALLATGRPVGSDIGLAMVSADASLFSNGMLWHGENALLAIRVSELLGENKRQLVFMTNRQVQGSYRERLQPLLDDSAVERVVIEPEWQKALRLTNAVVKEVAGSNVLNEALRQRPRDVPPARYFRALLYTIATAMLCGLVWLLVTQRTWRAFFFPPRPMRASFELREQASGANSDFRNAAGYLAREFCYELTDSSQSADWQKHLAEQLVSGRKSNRGDSPELTKVVDIACRGHQSKMTEQQFQQFARSLDQLRASLLSPKKEPKANASTPSPP